MFGSLPGGEIIYASIPLPFTSGGGNNDATQISPGRATDGDTLGPEAVGGDTFGIEATSGETLG